MHHSLGDQTFISWSTVSLSTVVLQAVAVGQHNACQVEMTVPYLISTFTVEHQISQDLENWTLPSTSSPWKQTVSAKGHHILTQVTGVEAPYVRVVLKAGVICTAALMIGINLSEQ